MDDVVGDSPGVWGCGQLCLMSEGGVYTGRGSQPTCVLYVMSQGTHNVFCVCMCVCVVCVYMCVVYVTDVACTVCCAACCHEQHVRNVFVCVCAGLYVCPDCTCVCLCVCVRFVLLCVLKRKSCAS